MGNKNEQHKILVVEVEGDMNVTGKHSTWGWQGGNQANFSFIWRSCIYKESSLL